MRVLVFLSALLVVLACSCAPTSAEPKGADRPEPKLCACQREGGFAECFEQVSAVCTGYGEHASKVPMCQFDWSKVENMMLDPGAFMKIIKASAVMCKHPYLFNVTEMVSFLGATNFLQYQASFTAQKVTGAMMTQLTMEQLIENLGSTLGDAKNFIDGKSEFLSPGTPYNVGKMPGRDIPTVYLTFNVRSVTEIDEVKFEFQATVDIVMHWSDINIWYGGSFFF